MNKTFLPFCLIFSCALQAGKNDVSQKQESFWDTVKVTVVNLHEKAQPKKSDFIRFFNNASQEEKKAILKRGIFINPEDGHLWPWARDLNSEELQKIWHELHDVPLLWEK